MISIFKENTKNKNYLRTMMYFFVLLILLIKPFPLFNSIIFIQTENLKGYLNTFQIYYCNDDNEQTYIEWKSDKVNDTLVIENDKIVYLFIFERGLFGTISFPIFNNDSLRIIFNFENESFEIKSSNYSEVYTLLNLIELKLSDIETFSNLHHPNKISIEKLLNKRKLICDTLMTLINQKTKSKYIKKFLLSYLNISSYKIVTETIFNLFSNEKISSEIIPDMNRLFPSKDYIVVNSCFNDFNSFLTKVINLTYLKIHKKSLKRTFFIIRKKLFELLPKNYQPLGELRLISFMSNLKLPKYLCKYYLNRLNNIKRNSSIVNKNFLTEIKWLRNLFKFNLTIKKFDFSHLTFLDVDSNQVQLKDVFNSNRPLILVFWGTWCTHCLRDLEAIKKETNNFIVKKFNLVFIAVENKNFGNWRRLVLTRDFPGVHLYAENQFQNVELKKIGISFVPFHIVLNNKLRIFEYAAPPFDINPEYYDNLIEKLVN